MVCTVKKYVNLKSNWSKNFNKKWASRKIKKNIWVMACSPVFDKRCGLVYKTFCRPFVRPAISKFWVLPEHQKLSKPNEKKKYIFCALLNRFRIISCNRFWDQVNSLPPIPPPENILSSKRIWGGGEEDVYLASYLYQGKTFLKSLATQNKKKLVRLPPLDTLLLRSNFINVEYHPFCAIKSNLNCVPNLIKSLTKQRRL